MLQELKYVSQKIELILNYEKTNMMTKKSWLQQHFLWFLRTWYHKLLLLLLMTEFEMMCGAGLNLDV